MADDVARLVAVVEANLKGFTKGMEQAQRIADQRFGAIEKRMRKADSTLSGGFKSFGRTLLGGAALVGIERFVSHVVDAASKLQDTADALGVSTDALQEWGIIAGRAGISQDTFNEAIARFAKNVGEAQVKGGEFKKLLDRLGVGTSGSLEDVFNRYADAVANTSSQQQKAFLVTQLFGRGAAGLTPILAQGSAALREQGDELKRNGAIMTADAIDKVDKLGDKWEDLKRQLTATGGNVLAGFADQFSDFADELKSSEFQAAMKTFGAAMAEVAIAVAKMAPFMPEIIGGLGGLVLGGPAGGLIGVGVGAAAAIATGFNGPKPKKPGDLPFAPSWFKAKAGVDRSGLLLEDNGKAVAKSASDAAKAALDLVKALDAANVELTRGTLGAFKAIRAQIDSNAAAELFAIDEELKAKIAALDEEKLGHADYIKTINNLNDEAASKATAIIVDQRSKRIQAGRDEFEARYQLNKDVEDQRRDTIRSEHDAIIERFRGTQDYYKVQRELSDENAALEEQRIRDELSHQLETFARQKAEIDKAGQTWANYEEERKAATEKAELAIQAVHNQSTADRARLTEEETHALERQIQTMDEVRGGLEDVAAAGRHGFTSLKDAGAQFLDQLAEMALRLYILRPLLEATFGRTGTGSGGGLLGSFIGSIFGGGDGLPTVDVTPQVFGSGVPGRASGGAVNAGTLYHVNEGGRSELFRPDVSGTVIPLAQPARSQGSPIYIDARGAQAGVAEQIADALRKAAPQIIGASVGQVRRNLAPMMAETSKRHF